MTIKDLLLKLLGPFGLGYLVDELVAFLAGIAGQYPDTAAYEAAIVAWLKEKLGPVMDVEACLNTLKGIALDIASGMTGVDPGAWKGSG
jgi:hypothetical protein